MINQVIIVEGRDDTRRLHEVFGKIDTIETQGSAVPDSILEQIETVAQTREIVILTDPDFNGERIRRKVLEVVPNAKQAFLPRGQAKPNGKGSLGVEHASDADLRACLQHVLSRDESVAAPISQGDLLALGLIAGPKAKQLRERLGDHLHIGYANGKQLAGKLQMFQISLSELQQAMAEIETEMA